MNSKPLIQELLDAGIDVTTDSVGVEHLRFLSCNQQRVTRFNAQLRRAIAMPPGKAGTKSAHLAFLHQILPNHIPAASRAKPFTCQGQVCIDWADDVDELPQRRELCALTVSAIDGLQIDPMADLQAFLSWLETEGEYKVFSRGVIQRELGLDMMAWGARNLPMPLWAHCVGLRPMHPLSRATLARQSTGLALQFAIDEEALDHEVRISDLLDMVDQAQPSSRTSADHQLIQAALDKLTTKRSESPEQTINRWVGDLLAFHPRLESVSLPAIVVLSWMTDLCESGTVTKIDMRHYTRRRYCKAAALGLLRMVTTLGGHPSSWTPDKVEAGCLTLIADPTIRDKVGLGAAISSFLIFAHDTWGTPLVGRGLHALIPLPRPRAQFVSETEIKRCIKWTETQNGGDTLLLSLVRVALALGWAAPFRLQELLNLWVGNAAEAGDGGYEIEVLPAGWHAPLKTPAAMRRMRIPPGWAADLLRELLALKKDQGAAANHYLFGNDEEPTQIYRKYTLQTVLLRILKIATGDQEMTFHALRHSWASKEVAMILASSCVANFNRLIHVADAMGHVSPVTTLHFYSHQWESALNCHMSSIIQEEVASWSDIAELHLQQKFNTLLKFGSRNYGWDAQTSVWRSIEQKAAAADFPPVHADLALISPVCPRLITSFTQAFTPLKVLKILVHLNDGKHKPEYIAALERVSPDVVERVQAGAIALGNEWLAKTRRPKQPITEVAGVQGALEAMQIELHTAFKSKYKELRLGFAVPVDMDSDAVASWLDARDGVYFGIGSTASVVPLLALLKQAGAECADFSVRLQPNVSDANAARRIQGAAIRAFQTVWNQQPITEPMKHFHAARPVAYITFPGRDAKSAIGSPGRGTVKGLDALIFACAVYSRASEKSRHALT